ncbi:MAG: wax ester/triacylglycerol synthase family O-acyltransferase [Nocardiaceae bacterium]|nr:wax ester/triacylglycerol synthase family O-acyltransferase [Nocardiaceae bacterium]
MGDSLSATDRATLTAEKGNVNMTVGGLVLTDAGPGVTYDALVRRIDERIHLLPRYTQRLQESWFGERHPTWVEDENYDTHWHVHSTHVTSEAELARYVGKQMSARLDRSRPLWELHVIEGLPNNQSAVLVKMHHALVDGMSAVGVFMVLMDMTPEPQPVPPAAEPETEPRQHSKLYHYFARIPLKNLNLTQRIAVTATEWMLDRALDPRQAESDLRHATALVRALQKLRSSAAPLPFNKPISANRSFAWTTAPLDGLKRAGKASGGTVNDAILSAVSGQIARYLEAAGFDLANLEQDPVALVPVSVRPPGDASGGNRIAVVFVDLPVSERDPAKRIELISERMRKIKGSAEVIAGSVALDMTGVVPPLMSSALAAMPRPRDDGGSIQNIVVSNVPGPQMPLYFNGSAVHGVFPVMSLNPADQGFGVGVLSYNGRVCFGVTADKWLDPGVDVALAALRAELDEILKLGT